MSRQDKEELGRENLEWGQEAEQIASEYLLKEGYTIRERNWRMGKYEIDLILEKDNTIIFVEVKARRGDNIAPVDAVDLRKQQRTVRAGDAYLRMLPMMYSYRFDIVAITGTSESYTLEHLEEAFMPQVNGGRRY
ncbi:MAG: YraN family protein [Lepagella sp.]|nr:YraN family protein [Bacteroidales bacterium]